MDSTQGIDGSAAPDGGEGLPAEVDPLSDDPATDRTSAASTSAASTSAAGTSEPSAGAPSGVIVADEPGHPSAAADLHDGIDEETDSASDAWLADDDGPDGPDDDGPDGPDGVIVVEREPLVPVDDPEHSGRSIQTWISWAVVGLSCFLVFASLHPTLIFRDTTPTGGDMGAHVWGPQYLMDHLLPQFRLTGWSPDWYAGFPAYVFYMVLPSLLIVLIHVGPPLWLSPFLLAGLGALAWLVRQRVRSTVLQTFLWICLAVLALMAVPVPYNVAFKVVTVSGLVTLPLAVFALGRAAKLPFPVAPILAFGGAAFLYESAFTILGGNIFSTEAGEFAFSISLTLAILYLAVVVKGIRTGRDRALGATLLALTICCHLIPAIFAVIATVVIIFIRREDRTPWWDGSTIGRVIASAAVGITGLVLAVEAWRPAFPLLGTVVAIVLFVSFDKRALKFAAVAVPVGGLLASFWFVPFYLNSRYLNDMGWEKYTDFAKYLWPEVGSDFTMPWRNIVFALAGLGIILSLVHRVRLGWWLTMVMIATAWIFVFMPQYRLWNARILPFYLLCLYLLAALGLALMIRSIAMVAGDLGRRIEEPVMVGAVGMVAVGLVLFVAIAGSVRMLPGGSLETDPATGVQTYSWAGLDFERLNGATSWAAYNYKGLEDTGTRDASGTVIDAGKAYPEYKEIMDTMAQVSDEHGCGRAMWEYEPKLSRFGTPMALMLLPYFTDGCVGSMEGLYFEASSTTPYHFINQSELSAQPSSAQRDLPYPGFNMEQGVSHLQLLGVKYYMATSDQAIAAARAEPRLTEVETIDPIADPTAAGTTHQWVIFEVADSEIVTPLDAKPAVVTDADGHIDGWVYAKDRPEPTPAQEEAGTTPAKLAGPAMEWYLHPERWNVPLAISGPDDWPRVESSDTSPPDEAVSPAEVSDISVSDDSISFSVDKVGSPVLVKMSYFPNWKVSGAEGPYRVTPNQMVVVPTEKNVTLSYGHTKVDGLAWMLTAIGVVLVVFIAVREARRRAGDSGDGDSDEDGSDEGETGEREAGEGTPGGPPDDGPDGDTGPEDTVPEVLPDGVIGDRSGDAGPDEARSDGVPSAQVPPVAAPSVDGDPSPAS